MYNRSYGLRKTLLGKCLKMLALENLWTSKMLNGLKHCLNLHSSSIDRDFDQYDLNLAGKSLS